ncbi:MAG: hypothetical protein V7750_02900 [Sneathiella sp.]
MIRKLTVLSLVCASFLVAAPSIALTFNSSQFIGIDRDADNMISPSEAEDYRARYFETLDGNGDGTVEFEEYVQANRLRSAVSDPNKPVPQTDEYKEADTNKDTKLSRDEFLNVGRARFLALDKNKDHKISKAEFKSPGL